MATNEEQLQEVRTIAAQVYQIWQAFDKTGIGQGFIDQVEDFHKLVDTIDNLRIIKLRRMPFIEQWAVHEKSNISVGDQKIIDDFNNLILTF